MHALHGGLAGYEVRSCVVWYRHIILSLLAAMSMFRQRLPEPLRKKSNVLIQRSVPEVRKPLLGLVWSFIPLAERVTVWTRSRWHPHYTRTGLTYGVT